MNISIHVGRRTCRSSVDRYTTIVNFFLDNSAVNAYSEYFTTALQEAVRNDRNEMAQILLDMSPDLILIEYQEEYWDSWLLVKSRDVG